MKIITHKFYILCRKEEQKFHFEAFAGTQIAHAGRRRDWCLRGGGRDDILLPNGHDRAGRQRADAERPRTRKVRASQGKDSCQRQPEATPGKVQQKQTAGLRPGKDGKARQELTGARETARPCKPYPKQHRTVGLGPRGPAAARRVPTGGLSSGATRRVDRLSSTTEPGLQARSCPIRSNDGPERPAGRPGPLRAPAETTKNRGPLLEPPV